MNLSEECLKTEWNFQDEEFLHREPREEMRFYVAVAKGDSHLCCANYQILF